MFWRVHLSKEGDILDCTPVEYQGQNGAKVIFVEAETKTEACSRAKTWYARYRERRVRRDAVRYEENKRLGVCASCKHRPATEGRIRCSECREKENARRREYSHGRQPLPRTVNTPEVAYEKHLQDKASYNNRRGGPKGTYLRIVLRKFDELGPELFRAWLVSELAEVDQAFATGQTGEVAQAAE